MYRHGWHHNQGLGLGLLMGRMLWRLGDWGRGVTWGFSGQYRCNHALVMPCVVDPHCTMFMSMHPPPISIGRW